MPGTPILTRIEEAFVTTIASMTEGEYHYTWGESCTNNFDINKITLPNANIYLDSDTCVDDPDGSHNQAYSHESIYRIEVITSLSEESQAPTWAINVELNKCFDDLLKLFGNNWNLSGACDTIMYQSMMREYRNNQNIFIPSKMITYWLVKWESDRMNPDIDA